MLIDVIIFATLSKGIVTVPAELNATVDSDNFMLEAVDRIMFKNRYSQFHFSQIDAIYQVTDDGKYICKYRR